MTGAPCKFTAAAVGGDERREGCDTDAACDIEEAGVVVEGVVCWVDDGAGVRGFDEDEERRALAEEGGCAGV